MSPKYLKQHQIIPKQICCKLKSYKNPAERLYYEGIENKKQREKELDDKWKAQHPFEPNLGHKRRQSSVSQISNTINYDKKSDKDIYVQRYFKNNYDEKTGQPLFKPVVNHYNPDVINRAYKTRYKQELEEKAREIDKRIQSVFKFFTSGGTMLRIQDLDCINFKNECIVLLKNVIINIIKSNNHLSYNDFVDLVLQENLLPDIDRTYEFIEARKNNKSARNIVQRSDSLLQCDSTYDKTIERVINDQNIKPTDNEKPIASNKIKLTKNYSRIA